MSALLPLSDPTAVIGLLAAIMGAVFWMSESPNWKRLFTYLPAVIWIYFVPMIATTFGITPEQNPAYDWMSHYLLPFSLFLLMITVDLRAILKLGKTALLMMLAGTVGIVIGGPVAYLIFRGFLPTNAWEGLATLSGSWIGGTANMVAIQQHVESTVGIQIDLGPVIVVDTVVAYGWMGVLIALSTFRKQFNRWIGADTAHLEALNDHLVDQELESRPTKLSDLAKIVGLGLAATVVCGQLGQAIPPIRLSPEAPALISGTTWSILLVVTAGLLLSFTPFRRLEKVGASRIGYFALYLLLTSIGARANLTAVLDAPIFLLTGLIWITIHISILIFAARYLKAPMFFVATGSMANIGGAASAPVVAEVYAPALAPVGLLMAVAGYILGIYAALGCAEIFRILGTM